MLDALVGQLNVANRFVFFFCKHRLLLRKLLKLLLPEFEGFCKVSRPGLFVRFLGLHNFLKHFLGFAKTARGRMQVLCNGLGGLQIGLLYQIAQLLWHLALVWEGFGNRSQELAVGVGRAR